MSIKHLAIIMDGNRRWAKKQGWMPWLGHRHGVDTIKKTIEFCIDKNISYLTLYTFSLENFKRSPEEINYLFDLLLEQIEKNMAELIEKKVRVRFVGDRSLFPAKLIPAIDRLEKATENLETLEVLFLFCYGGRQEIIHATKQIIHKVNAGVLSEDAITEEQFKKFLWTGAIPDPDLIIRTGGQQRLSNFLLYQAAYSELYFTNLFWPELDKPHLQEALDFFEQRQRNFGI